MAAIFVGSGVGAVLGGAYLVAGPTRHETPAPPAATTAPATLAAAPAAAAPAAFAGAARPPAAVAKPFRFAAVAEGAPDLQCLTEAVYFEARGEPERGQRAVAQVVLNRVRHPAFPKTICAVVHQRTDAGCQFSFACARPPRGRDEVAWTRAQAVARSALHGAVMREIGDATHFESVRMAAFAGLLKVAQIGEHVFYRFGGHAGAAGMFHQTPAPSTAPRVLLASASATPPPAISSGRTPPPPAASGPASPAAASGAKLAVVAGPPVVRPAPAPAASSSATLVPAATLPAPAPASAKAAVATVAVAS